MSELEIPESWAEGKLENIVEFLDSRRRPVTASARLPGPYPYYGANGVQDSISAFLFDEPLLLLAEDGGHFGSRERDIAQLIDGKTWVNNHAHVLKVSDRFCRKFLFHFLRRFDVSPWVTGATVPKLNQAKSRSLPVILPPLAEQHRIVSKIESTHSKIAAIEKAVTEAEALLKKYRESLLAKAFRGELVPQDPNDEPASKLLERIRAERAKAIKNGEIKKAKKDDLPPISDDEIPFEIPKSWEWVRLGEIVNSIDAGWSPQCESRPRTGEEWGVLKISAVTWGKYRPDENKALPVRMEPRPEHEVQTGDFIISRANTLELVGRGIVVDKSPNRLMLNDKLLRIRFWAGVSSQYFNLINNGQVGRLYYESVASGTSSSMRNITREQIRLMVIPLPPTKEQVRIVEMVSASQAQNEGMALALRGLFGHNSMLRNSLLSAAFSGRLVPQDPSEGTGHELLAKILKEKLSEAETKKPKTDRFSEK